MKRFPLALQIWMLCAGVTLCVFAVIAALLPGMLQEFFTKQIFDIIQDSQKNLVVGKVVTMMESHPVLTEKPLQVDGQRIETAPQLTIKLSPATPSVGLEKLETKAADEPDIIFYRPAVVSVGAVAPVVQHMVLSDDSPAPLDSSMPKDFVQVVQQDARVQQSEVQNYSREVDQKTILYVIRKQPVGDQPGYVVSYSTSSYRNDQVAAMYTRLVLLMVILMVLTWPPSLWLARYLTRPLVQMEAQATRISERDWHQPLVLDRGDEIGRLAQAFENMRQRLSRQDEAQRDFFQNVSHELKTPVMVIRSYAQSILDGIFPKGTVEDSVEVINSEAERLEKRVKGLLHLNKLSYLKSREIKFEDFDLAEVVKEAALRFSWRRSEVEWDIDLPAVITSGDRELWGVAFENLFDNQTRFAEKTITVTASRAEGDSTPTVIRIWNDGPQIEAELLGSLFDPYQTGAGGEFGLGLAIVKQIADLHGAEVRVENEAGGAAFYIKDIARRPENVNLR
ncbi:MAG: HAMP domain-containing histidine kinase [Firmicutes bacterium]|nr:HAMP domain-containing histidine kinase [Bacillota bacterium]